MTMQAQPPHANERRWILDQIAAKIISMLPANREDCEAVLITVSLVVAKGGLERDQ